MITNRPTNSSYEIKTRNRHIKSTERIKFLGIMLDNKLHFYNLGSYIRGII